MAKKSNKKFSLKKEYKKSWKFIKESRNFIYAVIGIFMLFILLGFFVHVPESLSQQILQFFEEILEKTKDMSQLELTGFIFLNNLKSSFFGMIFGILLGIYPIITAIANGYVVGFVSEMSVQKSGFLSLLGLLPHGIFELPALFISLGLGLKLGSFVFQKKRRKAFNDYLSNSIRTFILIVIPLLIFAAIIEAGLIILLG